MLRKRFMLLEDVHALWAEFYGRECSPSIRTMQRWCKLGKLKAVKRSGKSWKVDMRGLKISPDPELRDAYEDLMVAAE